MKLDQIFRVFWDLFCIINKVITGIFVNKFTGIKNVFYWKKYYMIFISNLPEKCSFLPDGLFIAFGNQKMEFSYLGAEAN